MPQVKCSVANCEYWAEENNCNADVIMIDIDNHAEAHYDEEYAGESFDSNHKDEASRASGTCCHTFQPKSKS